MINPVPQGFVGSNPTSSIESSSVRCPKTETENLFLGIRHQANDLVYEMRDLYKSQVRTLDTENIHKTTT